MAPAPGTAPAEQPGAAGTPSESGTGRGTDHAGDHNGDHGADHGGGSGTGSGDETGTSADDVLLAADGCPSGFEPERAGFVAGHADRLVRSNSYVPLLCSYRAVLTTDRMRPTRMVNKLGVPRAEAFEQVSGFLERLDRGIGEFEARSAEFGEPEPGDPSRLARVGGMGEVLAIASRAFAETVRERPPRLPRAKAGMATRALMARGKA